MEGSIRGVLSGAQAGAIAHPGINCDDIPNSFALAKFGKFCPCVKRFVGEEGPQRDLGAQQGENR